MLSTSYNNVLSQLFHRYFNYAKERVCGHKMALISSMEATHRKTHHEDNLDNAEKIRMLRAQIKYCLEDYGIVLNYPSGTEWKSLV